MSVFQKKARWEKVEPLCPRGVACRDPQCLKEHPAPDWHRRRGPLNG